MQCRRSTMIRPDHDQQPIKAHVPCLAAGTDIRGPAGPAKGQRQGWRLRLEASFVKTRIGWVTAALVLMMCRWANAAGAGVEKNPLPWSLRGVRDSLRAGDHTGMWFFQIIMALLAGLVVWLIMGAVLRLPRREQTGKSINKPQRLFRDLLEQLDLDASEKRLLQRMAAGARLKHPAMAVLSPGLLEWARKLWLVEKGNRAVNARMNQRLDRIAGKLFDLGPSGTDDLETAPVSTDAGETDAETAAVVSETEHDQCN